MRTTVKLTAVLLAVMMMLASLMSFTGCSEVANEIAGEIGAEIGNEIDRIIADEVESHISKGIERYENIYVDHENSTQEDGQDEPISGDEQQSDRDFASGNQASGKEETPGTQSEPAQTDSEQAEPEASEDIEDKSEKHDSHENGDEIALAVDEDGVYTSKNDVALYIHTYGRLPDNFITKNEARKLGWNGGGLEDYAPGKCIGGDRFGNYEGLLPEKSGRKYTECDIDTLGKDSRGAKRIVFSNDGLVYYTDDHYDSFTLVYGEE